MHGIREVVCYKLRYRTKEWNCSDDNGLLLKLQLTNQISSVMIINSK